MTIPGTSGWLIAFRRALVIISGRVIVIVGIAIVGNCPISLAKDLTGSGNGASYSVRVHLRIDPATAMPGRRPFSPGVDVLTSPSNREARVALQAVRDFLSAYPAYVIRDQLGDVYVAKEMRFTGLPYLGTYSDDSIYVAVRNSRTNQAYDRLTILETLHAEFSSVLIAGYSFPKNRWHSVNGPGFEYGNGGRAMLARDAQVGGFYATSEHLLSGGFLYRYSTASLEEDVNMYALLLFTERPLLDACASRFPRVAAKLALVEQFYGRLGMTSLPREAVARAVGVASKWPIKECL